MKSSLQILSEVFGWVYFFAWSISFYPQIYVNYKLRSVEGYHLDYPFLNFSGYIFYSMCYTVCYFIKDNPFNNYGFGTIKIQDLVFAYHSTVMATILGLQCIFYKKGKNKLSPFAKFYALFSWGSAVLVLIISQMLNWIQPSERFNIILYLGYLKLGISIYKYLPPAYWNYKRKSTEGFSISAILLDFTGGLLSLGQNIVDLVDHDTPVLNPVKFGLGNITIIYDVILMIQHYVLYNKKNRKEDYNSLHDENDSSAKTSQI